MKVNEEPRSVELHTPCEALLGEGPIWDWRNDRLLWVDAENGGYYCAEGGDPQRTGWHDAGVFVSSIALIGADGEALLFTTARGLAAAERPGSPLRYGPKRIHAISVDYDTELLRMNDSVADPLGRLWVGTMRWDASAPEGTLYCFATPEEYCRRRENMTIPNGMGFSPDTAWFYVTDSPEGRIDRYPFTPTGAAYSPDERLPEVEPFIDTKEAEGVPDGLTVAADGSIFSARWGGRRVDHFSSMGRLVGSITVEATQPSSCALGGQELNELYITSARRGLQDNLREAEGGLFRLSGVGPGLPEQVLSEEFLVLLTE